MEIFLTHLPRVEVRPVTSGSKRHMLLLTLARPEGATPEDLSAAVGWTIEAALTGVRWDVVHELGYGIGRDRRGRFHLVLPPGVEEILTAAHRGVGTWLRERFEDGERDYHDLARRARALFGGQTSYNSVSCCASRWGFATKRGS